MKYLDINSWNRKQHFEHFSKMIDPYFAVVVDVDVTRAYNFSKESGFSFFALYLHACICAVNKVENFKYRIEDSKVVVYEVIHASATIAREDNTFGCSFIPYSNSFDEFNKSLKKEKERILKTTDLFPTINSIDCIYASSLPWINFSSHKEPFLSGKESVPKFGYGKFKNVNGSLMMPVSLGVNHALMDGYHVGQFFKYYQQELNKTYFS